MSERMTGPGWFVSLSFLNLASAVALWHSCLFFWAPRWIDLAASALLVGTALVHRYGVGRRRIIDHIRRNPDPYLIGALAILAFLIRRQGLYFGLPFCYGVDEPAILGPATSMISSGNFNPRFFHYPSFGYYITAAAILLGYLREAAAGVCRHFSDLPGYVPYYYARLATATLSAATVPALYLLGRRIANRWAAALGALLLAVSHLSAESARNAGFHGMTPLFVTLSLLALVEFVETTSPRWAIASGALAGLAISTMYYAASLLLVLVVAVVAGARRSRILLVAGVFLATTVAFLATTPYALLDLPTFANQLGERMSVAAGAVGWGMGATGGGTARNYSLGYLSAFGFLAAGCFLVCAVSDMARFDRKRVLLFGFVVVHLAYVGAYPSGFARYLGPLEPIYLLLAATGFIRVVGWLRESASAKVWRPITAAAVLFLLARPVLRQWEWFIHSRAPLASSEAHAWVEKHLDPTGLFLREDATPFLPKGFTHELPMNRVIDRSPKYVLEQGVRYILVSRGIYTRNIENETAYARYLKWLHAEQCATFDGNDGIANPTIEIYEIHP